MRLLRILIYHRQLKFLTGLDVLVDSVKFLQNHLDLFGGLRRLLPLGRVERFIGLTPAVQCIGNLAPLFGARLPPELTHVLIIRIIYSPHTFGRPLMNLCPSFLASRHLVRSLEVEFC